MPLLQELRHFPGLVRWSHSAFALPFALASLLLAVGGLPGGRVLLLVMGAVLSARVAAMAFNRIADAELDALNPRTAERHLPSGRLSRATAWGIVLIASAVFVLIAALINPLAGLLSPVALVIVLGYSYTKRFTAWSHFVLGLALGLAPVGTWVAARAVLWDFIPWFLALAVICWVAGFDTIYSLHDNEFDRSHGLHSMGVVLGKPRALGLARALHAGMLIPLVGVGVLAGFPWPYYAGLAVVMAGLLWVHVLIRCSGTTNLEGASLGANTLVSFGYLGAVALGVFAC